jgi:indole-3-glycerol phosphate synthase
MKRLDRTHILTRIVEAKMKRLEAARMRVPEPIVKRMAATAELPPSFSDALATPTGIRIIAEVKKASPSKGVLRPDMQVEELATIYTDSGATAISVVTEEDFFQGDLGWVSTIRKASPLPVLRKDFVVDEYQVYETRAAGASAILFIVAMLDAAELNNFIALAKELKLAALVEVHDEAELEQALEAGASIIGVNNRDLKTFHVRLETSIRLGQLIPDDRLFVVESGIHSRQDMQRLTEAGADAFLIGEYFVTSTDPAAALRGLL